MKASLKILSAAVCSLLLGLPAAQAETPIHVVINAGTVGNELVVSPRELTLKVGEVYRFVVSNPSENIHVVAAPELAATVHTTQLVKIGLPRLGLDEGRGGPVPSPRVDWPNPGISEGISLQPGQMIEWTFTPVAKGKYKFACNDTVHAAAGMHATVEVISQDAP